MPPRLRCSAARGLGSAISPLRIPHQSAVLLWASLSSAARQYATAAAVKSGPLRLPDDYVHPTTPPAARPAETRKSQLLRSYTALLRTTPLMLIFQHNNLTAVEWAAIRRELRSALANVSTGTDSADVASQTNLEVVRTRIFDVALKIVEFYDPSKVAPTTITTITGAKGMTKYNHDLSKAAFDVVKDVTTGVTPLPASSPYAQLAPLMVGPLAVLSFPAVSPAHLAAALSILSPSPPAFPAPTRRKNPGYYETSAQEGLQKLMLIGGRVEGKVFDLDGIKYVGSIEGGLDSLRTQLVMMLQSAGLGLTSALEGASKSLWLTMESRKIQMEEAEKPAAAVEEGEKKEES
ncbi:hypothetical protein B0H63DRAFT_429492 [Podospora didyma]|uniref:54S ribosomal protein L11, mitochondrial n=1 Tax=Podospora didyma TaxID=330526 RepID=A0AAE0NZS8_9PEZI|nr:hypothetical protein B0H63DRAFT_429492 [Podospora didyma]